MNTCSGQAHRASAQLPFVGRLGTDAVETLPLHEVQTSDPLMVAGPRMVSGLLTVAEPR